MTVLNGNAGLDGNSVLEGYKVIDLSILVQGPQAASMLGDLGADVVKVELPEVGDLGRWLTVSQTTATRPWSGRSSATISAPRT